MMSAATAIAAGRSKYPFTATQWQELEHQALIYKYMAAGIPIPPDLLFSVKRNLDSSLSSKLFPYQTSPLGWNTYRMGYGKKIDPEPGRCRRTDGKKWRCSKEAYPDSKYCERHMHRGKNRSRKPVESPLTASSTSPNPSSNHTLNHPGNLIGHQTNNSTNNTSLNSAVAASLTDQSLLSKTNNNNNNSSSFYSPPSSDSSYTNSNFLYPHSSSYNHKDYSRGRYYQGLKQVGEHAFFSSESSAGTNMRGFSGSSIDEQSWHLGDYHSKQSVGEGGGGAGYPNYLQQLQNNSNVKQQQERNNCYIWGRDFNCELSMKVEEERSSPGNNMNEKTTTHHFLDEWPLKTGGGGVRGLRDDSSSTTQLSISIPSSNSHPHDFFRTS